MGKKKKIALITVSVIIALILLIVLALYVAGGTKIDENIPAVGVDVINVPFSGKGQETIPIQWIVHGADKNIISGAYFGELPSQVDFATMPLPDQIQKTFVPYHEKTLKNGQKVFQADIPNAYPVIYVVVYANIDDKHYWSREYMINSK